jgi:hypothetical protein
MGTMWDPMLQLQQVLWLLAYGASVYAAIAAQPAAQGYSAQPGHPSQHGYAPQAGHAALLRAQCRYCSTIYVVDPTPACPNCGAPYTG